jgi:large conductance mechanosensitive channel
MSVIQEFKSFAMRGNVVDLAVGVIIGSSFGAIVNSLVGDIIMPTIGIVTGNINFSDLVFEVGKSKIAYGKLIQAAFSFTIVAFSLFMVIKTMNAIKKKEEEKPKEAAELPEDIRLLSEIRDLLKK